MLSKLQVSSLEKDRPFVRKVAKQRQRFTPWLEQQIESGDIDGLEWIDKEIGIFKVPWVRVDKPEFELETHAELFKRWASHTGKYRPGETNQTHPPGRRGFTLLFERRKRSLK